MDATTLIPIADTQTGPKAVEGLSAEGVNKQIIKHGASTNLASQQDRNLNLKRRTW